MVVNKGERGKKKLADKWDATVYTVKDRNLQSHTYRLEDSQGNTKVVHYNLVLDICILPVVTTENEGCDTELEDGSSVTVSLDSLEEKNSEERMHRRIIMTMGLDTNSPWTPTNMLIHAHCMSPPQEHGV